MAFYQQLKGFPIICTLRKPFFSCCRSGVSYATSFCNNFPLRRCLTTNSANLERKLFDNLLLSFKCRTTPKNIIKRFSTASILRAQGGPSQGPPGMREGTKSTLYYIAALGVATLGLSYAAVPLYRIFCQVRSFVILRSLANLRMLISDSWLDYATLLFFVIP